MGFTPPNPSFEHQVQSLEMFARIAQESGPGEHHLTMCLVDDSEMVALHHAAFYERGRGVETNATALLDTCYMLAVGLSGKHRGGTFVRSLHKGQESICGWKWEAGEPRPLNRAETFDAYCSDPDSGELTGPEPGVEYKDAPVIHL